MGHHYTSINNIIQIYNSSGKTTQSTSHVFKKGEEFDETLDDKSNEVLDLADMTKLLEREHNFMNRLDKTVFTTSATNCSHIGAISPVNNHPIFSKFPVSQKRMIEKSKYRSLFDIGVNVSKCPFRLFENTSEASNSFDTQKNTYAVTCDHKLKDGGLIKKLR